MDSIPPYFSTTLLLLPLEVLSHSSEEEVPMYRMLQWCVKRYKSNAYRQVVAWGTQILFHP